MENNTSFWQTLRKIRTVLQSDPNLTSELRADPAKFLIAHDLDTPISLDGQRETKLSEILARSSSPERQAILTALFSLSLVGQQRSQSKLQDGDVLSPMEYDPGGGDYGGGGGGGGGYYGGGGGGGGYYGGGGGYYAGLALANVNAFINVNVAENANAIANANANQLSNANANQYANANANTNTNGIGVARESASTNVDLNSRLVELPDNYKALPLYTALQGLGLSLPRQSALFKRAINASTQELSGEATVEYTYRGISFALEVSLQEQQITIISAAITGG